MRIPARGEQAEEGIGQGEAEDSATDLGADFNILVNFTLDNYPSSQVL